jgi:hypothetical protein
MLCLRKVIYDESKKIEIIDEIINVYKDKYEMVKKDKICDSQWSSYLVSSLKQYFMIFKNNALRMKKKFDLSVILFHP